MSELSDRNRRSLAERQHWPAGAIDRCVRLERRHPGWSVWWLPACTNPGWERPAGYTASWGGEWLPGGDTMRRAPEDGVARKPRVFAVTVAALEGRIAAMDERIEAKREQERRTWASMRSFF